MTDLQKQNELADALIAKLERIKELWSELPAADDLADLEKAASSIATSLARANELWCGDGLPSEDDLNELERMSGIIEGNLERIKGTWEQLPSEDQLDELATAAGKIESNLEHAKETAGALAEEVQRANDDEP